MGAGVPRRPYEGRNRPCGLPRDSAGKIDKSRIIIIEKGLTEFEAHCLECFYIARYGRKDLGMGPLLNKTNGGKGANGMIVSEDTRKNMSVASKGIPKSTEHRARMSAAAKGRKLSPETIEKISAAKRGKKQSPETIAKRVSKNRGRKHTPETRDKMSVAGKGKPKSAEHVAKVADANRGRIHTPEARANMGDARKGRKWWTNGVENKFQRECPGPEWVRGRTKKK